MMAGSRLDSSLRLDSSSDMIQTQGRLFYDSRTLNDSAHQGNV